MEKSASHSLSQVTNVKQWWRLPGTAGAFDVLRGGASSPFSLPNTENPTLDLRQTLDRPRLRNSYKRRSKFSESSRSPKPREARESATGQREPKETRWPNLCHPGWEGQLQKSWCLPITADDPTGWEHGDIIAAKETSRVQDLDRRQIRAVNSAQSCWSSDFQGWLLKLLLSVGLGQCCPAVREEEAKQTDKVGAGSGVREKQGPWKSKSTQWLGSPRPHGPLSHRVQ